MISPKTEYPAELVQQSKQYTKPQLYDAFNTEHHARIQSDERFNGLLTQYKSLEYQKDWYKENYFRTHFKHEIAMEDYKGKSVQQQIDEFFAGDWYIYETEAGGYFAMTNHTNFYNIFAAWTNPKVWRKEYKDMTALVQSIYDSADKPIYFSHSSYYKNVIANHSVEVADGVFQLILNEQDLEAFMEHYEPFKTNETSEKE